MKILGSDLKVEGYVDCPFTNQRVLIYLNADKIYSTSKVTGKPLGCRMGLTCTGRGNQKCLMNRETVTIDPIQETG